MWDLQTVLHKRATHDVFKQQFKVHPTNQGTNSPTLCVLWAPKLCRNTVKLKLASHQVIIWQLTFWECCWRTFCSTVMAGSGGKCVKFEPGVAKCTIYRSPKRYKKEMLRCPLLNQRHYGRHGRVTSASRQSAWKHCSSLPVSWDRLLRSVELRYRHERDFWGKLM